MRWRLRRTSWHEGSTWGAYQALMPFPQRPPAASAALRISSAQHVIGAARGLSQSWRYQLQFGQLEGQPPRLALLAGEP